MKATGIVRRIDELGRIVIPKEIRRTMRMRDGDPLEIYIDRGGSVILKKYSPIAELGSFAGEYAEALAHVTGHRVCVTDTDQVIAAAGGPRKEILGKDISASLEDIISLRKSVINDSADGSYIPVTDSDSGESAQVISPIICEGDAIGAVILAGRNKDTVMGDAEQILARCAAEFLGRQMEI